MNKIFKSSLLALIVILVSWTMVVNYSFIFSKKVIGEIVEVDRVAQPDMILSGRQVDPALLHFFAVAIKDQTGEIFTSSSQDSDWAAAKKGMCIQARFFPVPPWNVEKAGTYLNVRILQLRDCKTSAMANIPNASPPDAIPASSAVKVPVTAPPSGAVPAATP